MNAVLAVALGLAPVKPGQQVQVIQYEPSAYAGLIGRYNQSTDKRGHKWQGPAELTLNQNGDAITGTFVFTPPQAARVQVPISSGVVSKDSVTFSGRNQFQMASIELTFHGTVSGSTLSGTADMTSRSVILGPATETASLSLQRQ